MRREAPSEHGMPIKSQPPGTTGPHCKLPDPSFLVQCDYGARFRSCCCVISTAAPLLRGVAPPAEIVGFDQTAFFDITEDRISLNRTGYLYVPAACENGTSNAVHRCRLHVAFHGCSNTLIGSTNSSSGTPATMLGRTQTTLSSCTRKPPHGTG